METAPLRSRLGNVRNRFQSRQTQNEPRPSGSGLPSGGEEVLDEFRALGSEDAFDHFDTVIQHIGIG